MTAIEQRMLRLLREKRSVCGVMRIAVWMVEEDGRHDAVGFQRPVIYVSIPFAGKDHVSLWYGVRSLHQHRTLGEGSRIETQR